VGEGEMWTSALHFRRLALRPVSWTTTRLAVSMLIASILVFPHTIAHTHHSSRITGGHRSALPSEDIMTSGKRLHLSIHQLIAYPGGRPLNCGEDGLPKTLTLSGIERTRISSQSAKRALRMAEMTRTNRDGTAQPDSLRDFGARVSIDPSHRTRHLTDAVLVPAFIKAGIEDAEDWAAAVSRSFGGAEAGGALEQPVVLGAGDVIRLGQIVKQAQATGLTAAKAITKKNDRTVVNIKLLAAVRDIAAQTQDAGLDGALFGRMATSDLLDRADAAVRVGHAISTGPHRVEADFFSTLDDYGSDGPGAAHINNKPLTSGLFYRHTSADLGRLVSAFKSLSPAEVASLAGWLVRALYRVGLTQRIAGDAGAQVPVEMTVDITAQPPLSAALAFETPIERRDPAVAALMSELDSLDSMSGSPIARYRVASFTGKSYAAIDALSDALNEALTPLLAESA
jgi:CRISPR system Cascade subunit CasC